MAAGKVEISVDGRLMRFTLGAGWTADVGGADVGFQLLRDGASLQGFGANSFDGSVFEDACHGAAGITTIEATPPSFMDYLANRDGIHVIAAPAAVTLGGLEGLQSEITVVDPEACPGAGLPNYIFRSDRDGGDTSFDIGEHARVIAVAGAQGVVVIVAEALSEDGFTELIPLTDDILASMTLD